MIKFILLWLFWMIISISLFSQLDSSGYNSTDNADTFRQNLRARLGDGKNSYKTLGLDIKNYLTTDLTTMQRQTLDLRNGNDDLLNYSEDYMLTTTDGYEIGMRSEILDVMIEGMRDTNPDFFIKDGNDEVVYQYFACIVDNLFNNIEYEEYIQISEEGGIEEFMFSEKNFGVISDCAEMHMSNIFESDYKICDIYNNPYAIKACAHEVAESSDIDLTYEEAEVYCTCVMEKAIENGVTYGEILDFEDQTSAYFNEIITPCFFEALGDEHFVNKYDSDDISGGSESSKVPMVELVSSGYNVKLSFAGLDKYFLFDTGAADMVIDSEIEEHLIEQGIIEEEDYLQEEYYYLANNEMVVGRLVSIDEVKIGDYVINNVVVAIIDNGSLLLGKSFLDKFSSWEIDVKNKFLIIYR